MPKIVLLAKASMSKDISLKFIIYLHSNASLGIPRNFKRLNLVQHLFQKQKFLDINQRCCRGPQTQGGAFLELQNYLGGIFAVQKAPRKLEKYYFFMEKINIWEETLQFSRKCSKIFSQKIFLQKNVFFQKILLQKFVFQKKNFFFQKFFQILLKILIFFENYSSKMQKKSIIGENWWVTKTTWGHFFPSTKPPGGKITKSPPPYNISDCCSKMRFSLKMQKTRFSKNWWGYQNPLKPFFPLKTHLEGKIIFGLLQYLWPQYSKHLGQCEQNSLLWRQS